MRPLSGLDDALLAADASASGMHVIGVAITEPPDRAQLDATRVREVVRSRLDRMPPLRRRLATTSVPFDSHAWLDAGAVDLERHVVDAALCEPDDLASFVGRIADEPLDLTQPPWKMWLLRGLRDERAALACKVHHAAIDGVAALGLVATLFDFEAMPAADVTSAASEALGEPEPSIAEVARRSLRRVVTQPRRLGRALVNGTTATLRVAATGLRSDEPVTVPFSGPRLVARPTGRAGHGIALAELDKDRFDLVRKHTDATLNDVAIAVLGGAMRAVLEAAGALPSRPLVAAVPVSVRGPDEPGLEGNRVSVLFTAVPLDADPVLRLDAVVRRATAAKRAHEAFGPETLGRLAGAAPPALFRPAIAAFGRLARFPGIPPPANLILSNVPGPPVPLYLGGHRIESVFAAGPVFPGIGLNVTVISYCDRVSVTCNADPDGVPGVADLARSLAGSLEALERAVQR